MANTFGRNAPSRSVPNLEGMLPPDQYRIFKVLTTYSYVHKNSLLKRFKGHKLRNERAPSSLFELVPGESVLEKYQAIKKENLIVQNNIPGKHNRLRGIPQGSSLSSLLSNIYLLDYDKDFYKKSKTEKFLYRRYCDDIIIVCKTNQANQLKETAIKKILQEYYLEIQDKKVETIDFRLNSYGQLRGFKRVKNKLNVPCKTNSKNEKKFFKSLQYLGFEFNGQNVYIRSSSLSRYFIKMRKRVIKTVSMAYGASGKSNSIFLKQIFNRYSHLGERNFIKYAYNASKTFYQNKKGEKKEGMNSPAIKKQLSKHFLVLMKTLTNKNAQRTVYKLDRKKAFNPKSI